MSSDGKFYRLSTSGLATNVIDMRQSTGVPFVSFTGLSIGPQNLQNGAYQNVLFASTSNELYAFDLNGNLQTVFDNDDDGMADDFRVSIGGGVTGIAFSPLDFNLWHTTDNRGADAGHGINEAFDESRDVNRNGQTDITGVGGGVLTDSHQPFGIPRLSEPVFRHRTRQRQLSDRESTSASTARSNTGSNPAHGTSSKVR